MRAGRVASGCRILVTAALAAAGPGALSAQSGVVTGVVRTQVAHRGRSVVYLTTDRPGPVDSSNGGAPVIDQSHLHFLPALIVVKPGTKVDFLNSDPILHNVFSPGWSGEKFDLGTYPSGSSRSHVFVQAGPHVILCHVHPEMAAYVYVADTPYAAVTDAGGRFRLDGVPRGTYTVHAWHRGAPPRQERFVVGEGGARGVVLDLTGGGGPLVEGAQ